jgi:hypothetical protein
MTNKTIREFLTERGQNPIDFACLDLNEEIRYRGWYTGCIVDIKRFGNFVVVLKNEAFMVLDGGQFETKVIVYPDGEKPYHGNHPEGYPKEIVEAKWEGKNILVRVAGKSETTRWLPCKPHGAG